MRRLFAAVLIAAILLAGAIIARGVTSSASAGTPRCGAGYSTGLTSGQESLHHWALRHGSDISHVITATLHCGGGRLDLSFGLYLNGGNDWRRMPSHVRLWAVAVPPGCARRACPGRPAITKLGSCCHRAIPEPGRPSSIPAPRAQRR
jgi:hypothetical protein